MGEKWKKTQVKENLRVKNTTQRNLIHWSEPKLDQENNIIRTETEAWDRNWSNKTEINTTDQSAVQFQFKRHFRYEQSSWLPISHRKKVFFHSLVHFWFLSVTFSVN